MSIGVTALFTGRSGSGKTKAANALAAALGKPLFRVDVAELVSKYIGETEKNLESLFREAAEQGAILFFDEADALFSKRTEVKDSHDRYANIEVADLLVRLEAFDGIVILTTNCRKNIDDAFLRRMQDVVEFPTPGNGWWNRLLARLGAGDGQT